MVPVGDKQRAAFISYAARCKSDRVVTALFFQESTELLEVTEPAEVQGDLFFESMTDKAITILEIKKA
jgi:hypothetical protein